MPETARYRAIARTLMREIETGKLATGSLLPRRVDLSRRFGLNGLTVNGSIALFAARGLVVSHRGGGTRITAQRPALNLAVITSRAEVESLEAWQRHLPDGGTCQWTHLRLEELQSRSDRAHLSRFDGLLWYLPYSAAYEWIRDIRGKQPQLVLNREMSDVSYVSTDHRTPIRDLTSARLRAHPAAIPVFLRTRPDPLPGVVGLRQEGFVDACREAGRFYEVLDLPEEFAAKQALLEERLRPTAGRPVLLVSSSVFHTGAVATWVCRHHWTWGKELLYSDFDDRFPAHVWGVRVTTFIQDYAQLAEVGTEKLIAMIQGKEKDVRLLLPPVRVDGDT